MYIYNQEPSLNFGTKIKFVSPKDFKRLKYFIDKQNRLNNYISQFKILPNHEDLGQCYRTNVESCITKGIRTCIGVNIVDTKNNKSSFVAHLHHSFDNLKNLKMIKSYIKGDNAILVGMREDKFEASAKIFKEIETECKLNKISVSKMKGLQKGYETDFIYNGNNDTMYMCVSHIDDKEKYVRNLKQLKSKFQKIRLARCDTIEFVKEHTIYPEYSKIKQIFLLIFSIFSS